MDMFTHKKLINLSNLMRRFVIPELRARLIRDNFESPEAREDFETQLARVEPVFLSLAQAAGNVGEVRFDETIQVIFEPVSKAFWMDKLQELDPAIKAMVGGITPAPAGESVAGLVAYLDGSFKDRGFYLPDPEEFKTMLAAGDMKAQVKNLKNIEGVNVKSLVFDFLDRSAAFTGRESIVIRITRQPPTPRAEKLRILRVQRARDNKNRETE